VSTPMRVMLLGPFAAKDGKGTVVVLPKKAQALLGFLLSENGREVGRDDLATLLWSNTGTEQARQSLRQCLSGLRRTLPDGSLVSQGEKIALSRNEELTSDLYQWDQLHQSDSLADLSAADALHRGEFLASLSLPHEPFEDWVANERQRFTDGRQNLLARIAVLQARAGDLAAAVVTARRLTTLDPFREAGRRLLIELLAASGERGLALVEHARVERMLREELQASPEPATQQLAEKIRRGQPVQWQWTQGSEQLPPGTATRDRGAGAPAPRQHFLLPDRPAVALLPFVNLTGDPANDDFTRAIAEDVTSALVRERWPVTVLVLATLSPGSARHGNEATAGNARYLVGGSLRRDARRARAVVHLTDAAQERQLWSAQVEAEAEGPFALYDRLCQQIVSKLAAAIRMAEIQRTKRQPVEELSAYDLYLRAQAVCRRGSKGNETALKLLHRAVELDPELGVAHALSARCLHLQRTMGWMHPEEPRLYDAVRSAHQALEVDETNPEALWMAGLALANIGGDLTDGRHLVDRSLAINPDDASAWIASSFVRALSRDPETAIEHFYRAQQVNPEDSSQHVQWHAAAMAYFVAERYDEADAATDRALAQRPGYHGSLKVKVATSALLGRIDRAQQAARKLLIVNPDSSIACVRSYWRLWAPSEDAAAAMVDGWRRAGMPEG
jgi:DNA-binding SARP family transcriptional activator/TolB-like protein